MGNFFKSLFSSPKEEETTEAVSKADKKNFDIFKYDGIRAQRIGQVQYAIKCFTEALQIQEDFETMGHLVSAYVAIHAFDEALELTNRMIEMEPEHIPTRLTRINVLFLLDKEEEALADCQYVIDLEEENQAAWFLMGKARKAMKDLKGALEDLTKAISLKEDATETYLLRAEVLLEMNQPDDALTDVEKVIELAPEEETTYLLRGQIHEKISDFSAAADDYKQVLELNPFNADASLLMGSLLINRGKLDDAILFFDEAIELKPDFAKAYQERGHAKELKGNSTEAKEDFEKAKELASEEETTTQRTNFNDMYKGGLY